MKKSLYIRTALFGSASALVIGVAIMPAITFAADRHANSGHHDSIIGEHHRPRGLMGLVGTVSAISVDSSGVGTVTITVDAMPWKNNQRVKKAVDRFLDNHPNFPKPGDSIAVKVDSGTKYMINNVESRASSLTIGTKVRVLGGGKSTDHKTAKLLTTNLQPPMHGHAPMHGHVGTVSSFNTTNNTMTVSMPAKGDHPATTITVNYTDSTKFRQNKTASSESALAVGATVRFGGKVSTTSGVVSVSNVKFINIK